eukprot:scaffold321_cov232-Chaetoceros_neogracile.AAC.1
MQKVRRFCWLAGEGSKRFVTFQPLYYSCFRSLPPQAKANKSLMDHRPSFELSSIINRLRLEESDYNSIDTPRVEERRHQHQHQPLQQQF